MHPPGPQYSTLPAARPSLELSFCTAYNHHSMRTYWGLDSHRDYLVAYRWAPDAPESQQVRRFRFPMTPRGLEELTTQLDRESWVALEVSGNA